MRQTETRAPFEARLRTMLKEAPRDTGRAA